MTWHQRLSGENPVHKVVSSHTFSVGGVHRVNKKWAWTCDCGKTGVHSHYGTQMRTRKQAMDAYIQHVKKEHGGLG